MIIYLLCTLYIVYHSILYVQDVLSSLTHVLLIIYKIIRLGIKGDSSFELFIHLAADSSDPLPPP